MKTFFGRFFLTLGVIFFGLLLVLGYLYVTDPWNLKPVLLNSPVMTAVKSAAEDIATDSSATTMTENAADSSSEPEEVIDENPSLTSSQEDALKLIGIDPAALPESLTPEQEACFVGKLGQARVEEIKAGAAPSAIDIFKANGCI